MTLAERISHPIYTWLLDNDDSPEPNDDTYRNRLPFDALRRRVQREAAR